VSDENHVDYLGGKKEIQLVRHGATKLNNDDVSVDRIRGWKDIPLSRDGAQEAERLGWKMANSKTPNFIVSSDLERAQETAWIISRMSGVPIKEITIDFRPWDVGSWSGKLSKDAIPVLADYAEHRPDEKIDGGESFNQFRARFFGGVAAIIERDEGVPAVVTHHRGERLIKAWISAGCPYNGDIDIKEFNKRGEPTGEIQFLEVPINKLREAATTLAKGLKP